MESFPPARRRTGRPLSFDRAAALRAAMLQFWRHGYETTSIADLTAAMNITPPSLYAAFGDKRRLFLETVALYAGDIGEQVRAIALAPSARQAAANLLQAAVVTFTGEETPPGCLLASATATGSAQSADVRGAVADIRRQLARALLLRIEQDVAVGRLPHETDSLGLSRMIISLIQGMSVLARDGSKRSELKAVASATLRLWPSAPDDCSSSRKAE